MALANKKRKRRYLCTGMTVLGESKDADLGVRSDSFSERVSISGEEGEVD